MNTTNEMRSCPCCGHDFFLEKQEDAIQVEMLTATLSLFNFLQRFTLKSEHEKSEILDAKKELDSAFLKLAYMKHYSVKGVGAMNTTNGGKG